MKRVYKYIVRVVLVSVLLSTFSLGSVYGQDEAPDCDICDEFLDDPDPGVYAQCFEENCSGDIPIDSHIWLIMVGGVAIVYGYSRKKKAKDSSESI